jgi:hypothetical protein
VFIDRTAEETPNVYFLNKVDNVDMLNILYPPTTDKSGNVVTQTLPVDEADVSKKTLTTVTESVTSEEVAPKKKSPIGVMNIAILAVLGVGLVIFGIVYAGKNKKKRPVVVDDDDEIYEEEPIFNEDNKSPF